MAVHPTVQTALDNMEQGLVRVAAERLLDPELDAGIRLRLASLERIGIWSREVIPERARPILENLLIAGTVFLQRANASMDRQAAMLRAMFTAARFVADAYERASQPGVLTGLSQLEACFALSGESLVLIVDGDELLDVCIGLVTALRMQKAKPSHE